ncbi:MAG: glutamate--tRNA ligase [Desulfurococcales archaeon ex4484_58]|nr:MAG: glutamate--tRNA ligase [Desulfurococcales archaeon ex4484_58]
MSLEGSLLEKLRESAYKHALLNAYKHGGKARLESVVSKVIAEVPEIRGKVREVIDIIKEVVNEVNRLELDQQRRILEEKYPETLIEERKEEEKKLQPLPNAVTGRVVTRFAPNPDYTIHLGNARPALLSYWYAEMYKGKMILRFEDTDPRIKASFPEAYEVIKDDLKWLGIRWDEEYIQSLRLPILYSMLRELIKRRGAYVDKCSGEEFKKYKLEGKACPHRDQSIETNLEELDRILEGYYSEGEVVIRVKTDMNHPDPSVRDWVAFRIIDTSKTPHPVVGDKYILWPTYNFAAAIDDHLMGVTHILRAKEHITNTIKQKYLYDHMGWKYPETIHFGRLSLEGVILSKSKMRKMIMEYGMKPYDDPRFGTLSGLKRRGIVREAIWEIVKQVGIKAIDAHISYVNLAAINRSIIDPKAKRYMAVENPVPLILELDDELEAIVTRHPSTSEKHVYRFKPGKHKIYISMSDLEHINNRMFRLIGFANLVLDKPVIEDNMLGFKAIIKSYSSEEARKEHAPIIQWVLPSESIRVELIEPIENKLKHRVLIAEKSLLDRRVGDIIQFYRIGFARIDDIYEDTVRCIFAHS